VFGMAWFWPLAGSAGRFHPGPYNGTGIRRRAGLKPTPTSQNYGAVRRA
jgi:hypothetical protein